jgi:cellobiose phosphorylase
MSDNVLNQLRNKRNRTTVTPRQDALLTQEQPQAQAQEQNSLPQPTPVTELANSTAATADTIAELKAELEKYPQTRRHSAIVLEKDLDQELTRFCKELGITVEVFLEAAWTVASTDNALTEKITTEAKRRYDQRKRVGQIKRLITMLSNPSK